MASMSAGVAMRVWCYAALMALLGGCSGAGLNLAPSFSSPTSPPTNSVPPAHKVKARIVIQVPRHRTKAGKRRNQYISPATQSLSLVISRTPSGSNFLSSTINLTPGSPGCIAGLAGVTCIINTPLPPGSYTATITTFSGLNGQGSILSQGQNEAFQIVAGAQNQISLTLNGVPASLSVTPLTDSVDGSQFGAGFTMAGIWSAARSFNIVALDATGNAIIGPGAPSFQIASSNANFSVVEPTVAEPNTFDIAPPGTQTVSTTLTATASFAQGTTCEGSTASCSLQFNLTYDPFAHDDWMTFAHDFQRTGLQTQSTGITTSTVSQLTQRWTKNLGVGIYGSPVVYRGNVIVVEQAPAAVVDLSAADGSVLWRTPSLGVGSKNTPGPMS